MLVLRKSMIRYFMLASIFMGAMVISDDALAHHGLEEPNSDAAWFTTLPPAAVADIGSTTLKPITKSLRANQSAYFNFYVDYISAGVVKIYILDENGAKVECTLNDTCASSILKIMSSGFVTCVNSSILHTGTLTDLGGSLPFTTSAHAGYWALGIAACSDSSSCEGKVEAFLGNMNDASQLIAGRCYPNWHHASGPEPSEVGGKGVGIKGNVYLRFFNVQHDEIDLTNIKHDFTIGLKVTGTVFNDDRD